MKTIFFYGGSSFLRRLTWMACWVVLLETSHAQTNFQIIKSFGFPALSTGAQPQSQMIFGADGMLYGVTPTGGSNQAGVIFTMKTDGSGYQVLHSFSGGTNDGSYPAAELLQAGDGMLYGTTAQGGTNSAGVIFKINTDGTGYSQIHAFNGTDGETPQAGLLQGREDGALYGTTSSGGLYYGGNVFRISTDGGGFFVLTNFTAATGVGSYAGLLEGVDGYLYGTTTSDGVSTSAGYNGGIFKLARDGSSFQNLHYFTYEPYDGDVADGRLVQGGDGYLYGTTEQGGSASTGIYSYIGNGTVYKINTNGGGYSTYFFPTSDSTYGANPYGGLHFGSDGYLYGAASAGGSANQGVLFKISTSLSSPNIIHNLSGTDGSTPKAAIIPNSDGSYFYGMASGGGSNGFGTAFQVAHDGSSFSVLHEFVSPTGGDGLQPEGPVSIYGNVFYGTTSSGALGGYGAAFSMNLNGSGYQFLHSFTNHNNSDGYYPQAALLKASDGFLYGTTEQGGTSGSGTVFKVSADGSFYTVLWNFTGSPGDGSRPLAGLIQGADGALYGTTSQGGTEYSGTVFSIPTNGGPDVILYNFQGYPDGQSPAGSLLQDRYGSLYGTTQSGGTNGDGSIFRLATNGNNYQRVYSFDGATVDGANPAAGLLQGQDGMLYGTTPNGGTNYAGIVFSIATNGSPYAILYSFTNGLDGANPACTLVQGANLSLYGTCNAGGADSYGTVFKINTSGAGFTLLHAFSGLDGENPVGGLALAADGSLWGAAGQGGGMNKGAVFELFSLPETISLPVYGPTGFSLNFSGGAPNQSYQILASTDLIHWIMIGSMSTDANGAFQYVDTAASSHPVRFYRTSGP